MVDRVVQRRSSSVRAVIAPILIVVGLLLGLGDIGARLLWSRTDPIVTYDNVPPPSSSSHDSEMAGLWRVVFDHYDAAFVGAVIGFNEPYSPGLLLVLPNNGRFISRSSYYYADGDWKAAWPSVVFRVEVAWKGVRQTEVEMPVAFGDSDSACVGRHFDVGSSYLVIAEQITHPITYTGSESFATSQCDPTTLFPYKYDPVHQRIYDLPDSALDLNLSFVGDGYVPDEQVNLLRFQPPVVLIIAGVLILAGVLITLWPRIKSPLS